MAYWIAYWIAYSIAYWIFYWIAHYIAYWIATHWFRFVKYSRTEPTVKPYVFVQTQYLEKCLSVSGLRFCYINQQFYCKFRTHTWLHQTPVRHDLTMYIGLYIGLPIQLPIRLPIGFCCRLACFCCLSSIALHPVCKFSCIKGRV